MVGGGQGVVAGLVDSVGGAEVHRCRGVPSDAGVAVDVVVFVEEPVQVYVRITKEANDLGKSWTYFRVLNWASL